MSTGETARRARSPAGAPHPAASGAVAGRYPGSRHDRHMHGCADLAFWPSQTVGPVAVGRIPTSDAFNRRPLRGQHRLGAVQARTCFPFNPAAKRLGTFD